MLIGAKFAIPSRNPYNCCRVIVKCMYKAAEVECVILNTMIDMCDRYIPETDRSETGIDNFVIEYPRCSKV